MNFPKLEVNPSSIPGAGNGLFALQNIRKGQFITEYGGRLVDREEGKRMIAAKEDTHLRALSMGFDALDGRIQGEYTLDFYKNTSQLGSIANHSNNPNARYVQRSPGRQFGELYGSARVLLKACRDIAEGEEIFVSYGKQYVNRHFTQ